MKSDLYIFHAPTPLTSLWSVCAGYWSHRGRKDSSQRQRNNKKSNSRVCLCVQFSHKRFIKMEQKTAESEDPTAFCCGLVMGEDDDRRNWRDSHCPLDVTTATSVLALISAHSLLFNKHKQHMYAPTQLPFHCVGACMCLCAFFEGLSVKSSKFLALLFISLRVA